MRTAKLIITTLLALQLFVTAGLCGGACCNTDADRADHSGAAAKEENYNPATEEKIEGGHCPMHAAKESKPKPQERKQYSSKPSQHSAATRRQNHHQTSSSSTINAHFCACSVGRQEQSSDALLRKSPEQRPLETLLGAPNPRWRLIESSPPQNTSPDFFQSHSPPFGGRQFNLRI